TDHLARHLGDQVNHFLAQRRVVIVLQLVHLGQYGFEGGGQSFEGGQHLAAAFLAAGLQPLLMPLLMPRRPALVQPRLVPFLVALVQALLKAISHCVPVLPLLAAWRDAGQLRSQLRQRRETMGTQRLHSTTASSNRRTSISPASLRALTWPMISWRTCSMRLAGTGPVRRISSSKLWAWRRGMVCKMASRIAGSAPLSAIAHCSGCTTSMMRVSASSGWRERMKKSYMLTSISETTSGSWARSKIGRASCRE